jgi:hypothetical protein
MNDIRLSLIVLSAPFVVLLAFAQLQADYALYRLVRDFGAPATAVVQSIEDASYIERPEGGQTLTYELDLPGPAIVRGMAHMSHDAASRFSPGQEISIVYAKNDPTQSALSVAHAWTEFVNNIIVVAAYIAVLALAIGLVRTSSCKSWRDETISRR